MEPEAIDRQKARQLTIVLGIPDDPDTLYAIAAALTVARAEAEARLAVVEKALKPFSSILSDADVDRIKTWVGVTDKTMWACEVPVLALLEARQTEKPNDGSEYDTHLPGPSRPMTGLGPYGPSDSMSGE